ncbi:hypothetical protein M8J75_006098 [Diaphorina citri]|nr:hypothetical protein M8J75_006098 [Diaphorina citri]
MDLCSGCSEDLPVEGNFVSCGKCENKYHHNCSSVTEASWRTMTIAKKKAWRCAECRMKNKTVLTRSGSNSSLASLADNQSDSGSKTEEAIPFAMYKKLLDSKFRDFGETINKKMDDKFNEFQKSLEFMGDTMDEMQKKVSNIQKKSVEMEKTQEKLKVQNEELKTKIKNLEKNLEKLVQEKAQEANNKKMEISGIAPGIDCKTFTDVLLEKTEVKTMINNGKYEVEKMTKPGGAGNSPVVKSLMRNSKEISKRDFDFDSDKIFHPEPLSVSSKCQVNFTSS